MLNGLGFSFWGDKNFLEVDRGGSTCSGPGCWAEDRPF